ncbi:DUF5134 domain-containing protein [Mycobacterium sp. smrl_JER01]|uniref:DUF5134 domain-containing protein n=1 Tax=Mycobacterium sp. smrl_JER01 TaxID=3402633 RepID=UPI003AC29EC1
MIDDALLRWLVTALFVISAADCLGAIVSDRRTWHRALGHALHAAMAVAMAVMAWPSGAALPTTAPMLFFLAATLWFAGSTAVQPGHRAVNAYHAAMMLAMSWMYAVMSGRLIPHPADGVSAGAGHGGHHGSHSLPGMDAADTAAPLFIDGLNWLCAVGFAVATAWWLYLYFARRHAEPTARPRQFFGILCQAMMAAGMAIMFAVML